MRTIDQVSAMQAWSREVRGRDGLRVALVPTMGALHEGHLSLVELARRHADRVVASVFVNPVQFDRADDFARYPRDLERDGAMLAGAGADVLFAPDVAEIYSAGAQTFVTVEGLSQGLCGGHRPGHFRGVTTVVLKLFTTVQPQVAVFGEKDYQQLAVIRRMVRDLFLDIDVVGAPIVREADGLAMSSRNRHLDAPDRVAARCLSKALDAVEAAVVTGERDGAALLDVANTVIARESAARPEYVALVDADTLTPVSVLGERALVALAVWVGSTRLIDNRVLVVPALKSERRSA